MPSRVFVQIDSGDESPVVLIVGRTRAQYEALLCEHPAPDGSDNLWGETLPAALIAACSIEPALTVEQAKEVYDTWAPGDADALLSAAVSASDPERRNFTRRIERDHRLREELAYCTAAGIEHCQFLAWCPCCQDKTLDYVRREREKCNGCGTHPDEWERDPDVYVGHLEECPGCSRLEAEDQNIPAGKRSSRAIKKFLVPREVGNRLMEQGHGVVT